MAGGEDLDLDVLVVDDEATFRLVVVRVLEKAGCRVIGCGSAEEALEVLAQKQFDVAFVDLRLPGMLGTDLMARIRSDRPEIDVIVVSAFASLETAIEAVRQSAFDYLLKPLRDVHALVPVLRRIKEKQRIQATHRQMMEDLERRRREMEAVGNWGRRLSESLSVDHITLTAVAGLSDLCGGARTVLLLSDSDRTLRCVAAHPHRELCGGSVAPEVLKNPDDPHSLMAQDEVLELAARCVGEPLGKVYPLAMRNDRFGILATSNSADLSDDAAYMFIDHVSSGIARALQYVRMSESTYRDGLTGLYNRAYIKERLVDEIARCQRYGRPLSLLFVDVDLFKTVNDTCGHACGDEVLMTLAVLLAAKPEKARASNRASDIPARWGGDEFILVLPETDTEGAKVKAERIRAAMADLAPPKGVARPPTVSIGVASFPANATDASALVDAADRALYDAKRGGRNRVSVVDD